MEVPAEALAIRLLEFLKERAGPQQQCRATIEELLWGLAARYPKEPRPRLGEVHAALEALRRTGKITAKLSIHGHDAGRVFLLAAKG